MPRHALIAAALAAAAIAPPSARAAITFAPPVPYDLGAGSGPDSVALADVDRSSGLDAVVAERTAGTVAVLLNRGDGTFADAVHYPACDKPADVVAGPIDADFAVDVAVRCEGGAVAVLQGSGDGLFAPPDVQPGLGAAQSLTLAQLGGGGPREIAYAAAGVDGPELCWSSYAAGDWATPECGDDPASASYTPIAGDIAAADLSDPPGSPALDELITGDYLDADSILFWGRDPTDGFASWTHSTRHTGDTSADPHAAPPVILATDLQRDGDVDVVAAHSPGPGGLAVFLWSDRGIPLGLGTQYASLPNATTGGAGDLDGDGLPDVALAGTAGQGMAHHGRRDGGLGTGQAFDTPASGTDVDMAAGDVTGDGRADLVMTAAAADSVSVLRATGRASKPHDKPPRPGSHGVGAVPKRVEVKLGRKFAVGRAKNPPATKTVQKLFASHGRLIAKGITFVPSKRRVAMDVKLTKKGRRLLKRLGELKVKLRVVARGTTGLPSNLERDIRLKLKAP
jgi:FG-GAP-like repeat